MYFLKSIIKNRAGGVGLNITSANVVIIFDPNWNPTHDLQAQDRAYRLGQIRDVHVYRLISSGCLEENIYLRQIYKMHLNKECVEKETTKRLFQISKDFKHGDLFGLKNLFSLNTNRNECYTRDLLTRYVNIEKGIAGIEVSEFIAPNESIDSLENEDEEQEYSNSSEDDDEVDDDDESFEAKMNKVLKKNNVLHVHSNSDLIKTSKIENHLRSAIKNDANPNEFAFECNIRPDLSTLDCIEIEEEDYENIETNAQHRFVLANGDIVQYGQVPDETKRVQFEKMAKILKISSSNLAKMVLEMSKETRFKKLKQFYTKTNPKLKEFYKMFSKKSKPISKNNQNLDYENLQTINDVMTLINDENEENEKEINQENLDQIEQNEPNYDLLADDELLFQNFMNHKEELYAKYSPFKKRKSDLSISQSKK